MELEYLDLSEVELDIAAVDSKKGESKIKMNGDILSQKGEAK